MNNERDFFHYSSHNTKESDFGFLKINMYASFIDGGSYMIIPGWTRGFFLIFKYE